MACGLMLGLRVAKSCLGRMTGRSLQKNFRFGTVSVTACRAELLQRRRCDGHGFVKNDPEFDVTNASNIIGTPVAVEFKKRPTGVMRYSHGANGIGAIVLEMQEKSRYPGDPKGQAAIGGIKTNYVIKSIGGQECLTWNFADIM